jgi:hypothetical protein
MPIDGGNGVGRAAEAPVAGRRTNYTVSARATSMDSRSQLTTIISREASFDEDGFDEEQTTESAASNEKGENLTFYQNCTKSE